MAAITLKFLIFILMAVIISGQPDPTLSRVIEVKGGPDSVVWVVQLSDLHFSVHHPDRALDFKTFVGPYLSIINPSLILITGDLTGFSFLFFIYNFIIYAFYLLFFVNLGDFRGGFGLINGNVDFVVNVLLYLLNKQ